MKSNLLSGSVLRGLIRFSLPILGANLLQSCYNVADMAVVGRFTGRAGLAGVSSAAMLCYIINALCTGLTTGGSVLAAQYLGAGDHRALKSSVGSLFALCALAALLLTLLGLAVSRPVFLLMNLPAESMAPALDYMRPMCLGTVFVFGYNAVCAVLRGLGDSKSPLVFVALATLINVLLDLLLVGPLGLGTAGAALATVCAQGCSFLGAICSLRRRRDFPFDFSPASFRPAPGKCRLLLRIGLPTAVQMAVLNTSYLLVTGLFNAQGVAAAAAAGVGLKVNTLAAMPCWAVGCAVTTMAGQCVGAGDLPRAARTARAGVALGAGACVAVALAVQVFAAPIVAFFNPDPAVVEAGVFYLRLCGSLNCPLYAAMYVYDSFATGVGAAGLAMLNAMVHSVAVRVTLSWLWGSVLGWGFAGLCLAEAVSPLPSAIVGAVFFHSGLWRRHTLTGRAL